MMNFILYCYVIIHLVVHSKQNEIVNNNITIGIDSLNIESTGKYIDEAEEYGIQEMNKFYDIEEPKLFSNGLFLTDEHPAKYVAAFNSQTDEAKNLSKLAYAALKGSKKLIEIFGNSSFVKNVNEKYSNRKGTSGLRERCQKRNFPLCTIMDKKYRTFDGSCNNLQHPWWGSAMSTMQRFIDPVYHDGIEAIRKSKNGNPLPSARDISSIIHVDKNIPLASVTHFLMQWGQFIDHDITATAQSRGFNGTFPQCCRNRGSEFQPPELTHPDCLPIVVDSHDDFFGKLGVRCLEFVRSGPSPKEDCAFGSREQLSQVTSFIDASMIYSSSTEHSNSLRIFRNGLLQYGKVESRKPVLPKGEPDDLCKRGSLSTNCFRAGDARLSEQPALTSLHVVFLRLHNKIATELSALNSQWNDEKLFQESRKIVGAIVQHITYKEYLPLVLGPQVMKIFELELVNGYSKGYDPTVDPTVVNSFSSAAYRFGHSLVQSKFDRYDKHHNLISNNVTIHEEFGNRADLQSAGSVDRLILGMVNQVSQRRDEYITKELTNHLFQFPGFPFGMDLAAINIQRGRDHGLAPYVEWRKICSLKSIETWNDMENIIPIETVEKLKIIYENVDDVDLFTAGIAEKPVIGGLVGPTFSCIIAQQFSNLKKGDRFWYENTNEDNQFTIKQLKQIKRITLSKILCNTLDNIQTIQPFVFLTPDTLKNTRISCNNKFNELKFNDWIERRPKSNNLTRTLPWSKPVKTNVNQKNRIVVKRPHGTNENVTIVVQNHAISSPVFITDSIYTSNVKNLPQQSSDSSIDYGSYEDNDSTTEKPVTVSSTVTTTSKTPITSTTIQPARFNDWFVNSRNPGHSLWPNRYGTIISNPPTISTFINEQDSSSRSHYNDKNISKPLLTTNNNNKLLSVKIIEEKQKKKNNESVSINQDDMKQFIKQDNLSIDELPKPILKRTI